MTLLGEDSNKEEINCKSGMMPSLSAQELLGAV